MAKKNYLKMGCTFYPTVIECDDEKAKVVFKGKNVKGTEIEATVTIELYHMPHLSREFSRIAKKKNSVSRKPK